MKIMLVIDGDNLYKCQRDHLGWWIDPNKLKDWAAQLGTIERATYYASVYDDVTEGREKFFRALSHMGYSLVVQKVKHITQKDGTIKDKGSMDVKMAVDICMSIDTFDMLVLVSGDGDFVPVIQAVQSRGKLVRVLSYHEVLARDLRELCGPCYVDFDSIRDQIGREDADTDGVEL